MTQSPRTLSELAAAYYATLKTTIGADEPLAKLYSDAQQLPYFIEADSVRYQDGQPIDRYFDFQMAASESPYLIGHAFLKFKILVLEEAEKQGLKLVDNGMDDTLDMGNGILRMKFELRMGESVSDFQSFTKGLGVLLRAATQHKRDEAYKPAPGLEDFFL